MSGARLSAVVDGVPLPEPEARAVWERFSAYMDAHRGDLAGFAKAEGFASVFPESRDGRAVLVLSRTAPQKAYGAPNAASDAPRQTRKKPAPGTRR